MLRIKVKIYGQEEKDVAVVHSSRCYAHKSCGREWTKSAAGGPQDRKKKAHLEFLVAVRLPERRFAAIVVGYGRGSRSGAVAASGADGFAQFPLAGLAEAGQSPFDPMKHNVITIRANKRER